MRALTVFELEADGYTHAQCRCDGCGFTVLMPFRLLRLKAHFVVNNLTLAELKPKLVCERCPDRRQPSSITPWRVKDAYNRPTIVGPISMATSGMARPDARAKRFRRPPRRQERGLF